MRTRWNPPTFCTAALAAGTQTPYCMSLPWKWEGRFFPWVPAYPGMTVAGFLLAKGGPGGAGMTQGEGITEEPSPSLEAGSCGCSSAHSPGQPGCLASLSTAVGEGCAGFPFVRGPAWDGCFPEQGNGLLRRSASPTVGRGKWLPSAKMFLFFSYSAFFGSLGEGIGVSAC